QLLGHLGEPAHASDRRCDRAASRRRRASSAGSSRREPGGVYGPRRRGSDLAVDRRRPPGSGRHGRDGQAPRRSAAARQGGTRGLPAADGGALRFAGRGDREQGVHVPVRDRCRMPRVEDDRGHRADARVLRHHVQPGVPPHAHRRGAHRSPQHRSRADDPVELAPAARRQPDRLPVSREGVPDGRAVRILSITAGAAGMYCGSCLRDNALAAELLARGHAVTLLPLYTPTRPDETNVSRKRVLFGGISIYLQQYLPLFRKTPRLLDRLWDSPWVINAFAKRSLSTDPKLLGDMTISMLEGERGVLRKEFDKLLAWIAQEEVPDVINLPNALLIGLAAPLR